MEDLDKEKKEEKPVIKKVMHTYADDLSKALDTTDASVVQDLLVEGRERELEEQLEKKYSKQKGWYTLGAIFLILFTLVASAYTVYHYLHLTVPAQKNASVGVFPSTSVIPVKDTDIREVIQKLVSDSTLEVDKPYLVPLVSDSLNLTLLTNSELFSFFEANASEPLLTSFNLMRLGVMNTGEKNVPFILASMVDTDVASKELLIAENDLLKILYKPLDIDLSTVDQEIGSTFTGEYMYNIPVRSLRIKDGDGKENLIFFYGRVTDNIVLFTTSPLVLREVYDSIIRQHQ